MSDDDTGRNDHSAIPSWSGFIYQGKVALYHTLSLINENASDTYALKVETLDDFVIYDENNVALSLHQVKATQSHTRSSYKNALQQASEVNHDDHCTAETKRWFHVAVELGDFSDFKGESEGTESTVSFYTYSNAQKYVRVDEIDALINEQIGIYLENKSLNNNQNIQNLKRSKLEALLASRVNLAHRRNQDGLNKYDAADSVPILFDDTINILDADLIDGDDEPSVLFRFKKHLLDVISAQLAEHEEEEEASERFFTELSHCHHAIAKMEQETLKRLYFSKSPHIGKVQLEGFGQAATEKYLDIISELTGLRILETKRTLPHYYLPDHNERYVPTTIELGGRGQRNRLKALQENIEGMKSNPEVQHVLYEYENLVVKGMEQESFRLKDKLIIEGNIMDIEEGNAQEQSKITKMKNIRFVPLKEAKDELNS